MAANGSWVLRARDFSTSLPNGAIAFRPQAAGVLSVRDGVDMFHTSVFSMPRAKLDLAPLLHDDARRYEAGLSQRRGRSRAWVRRWRSLDKIGAEAIRRRVTARVERLMAGPARARDSPSTVRAEERERSGIVSFETPGDPERMVSRAQSPRHLAGGAEAGDYVRRRTCTTTTPTSIDWLECFEGAAGRGAGPPTLEPRGPADLDPFVRRIRREGDPGLVARGGGATPRRTGPRCRR
jgi:hypothetical protein